eukprot:TRINITY_DN7678_c1_g1_i1.p1 TRINITY_DN7678_c1_g1~~TRINITY_DN7678_c1_g1_i1.p1  ORF type:complete len:291 (+),score=124.06 TRINITY_DN7678_c1_g1_i1:92-874(+)
MGTLEQQRVKRRLFVALGACAAVLIVLLGWNLGSLQQDTLGERMANNARGVIQMIRERLVLCEKDHKAIRAGRLDAKGRVEQLKQESDLLGRENELLAQTNEDLSKSNEECEEDKERSREEHYGTREANVSEVIVRLRYENERLDEALTGINRTARDGSADLRARVRALRLENRVLQQDLRQRLERMRADRERKVREADSERAERLVRLHAERDRKAAAPHKEGHERARADPDQAARGRGLRSTRPAPAAAASAGAKPAS